MARQTSGPTITGEYRTRVTEDAAQNVVGGDLDVRGGADLFAAFDVYEGTYGTFTMAADGIWSYTLDNSRAVTQALGRDGGYDFFIARTADGLATQPVTVIIRGEADPVAATEIGLMGASDNFA